MTQLKLVYSSNDYEPKTQNFVRSSNKLKMSRVTSLKLPSAVTKLLALQAHDPAAAAVIERLVEKALRRAAG